MNFWNKYFNVGHAVRDNRGLGVYINKLFNFYDNLYAKYTDSSMTQGEKDRADYDYEIQNRLNEEEFERKGQWFEKYESPEALVRQYKSAGINPALMYQGAPGVSASGGIGTPGDAGVKSPSPSGLSDIIGSIIGLADLERKDRQQSIDAGFQATHFRQVDDQIALQRMYQHNYGRYLNALAAGKEIENEYLPDYLSLRNDNLEKDTALKENQAKYFSELCSSEGVRRDLMRSGIKLNDASAAGQLIQNSILEAQSRYADEYFAAVKKYQEAVANMADIDASIYESTKDTRLKAAEAELCDVVIKAAMDARIYEGDAFAKAVEGKMSHKEITQFLGGILKTVITAGTAAAVAAMKFSANGIAPPMTPGMNMQSGAYFNPYGPMPAPGI